jgi:uncharacterized protein (TIGR04255 family)
LSWGKRVKSEHPYRLDLAAGESQLEGVGLSIYPKVKLRPWWQMIQGKDLEKNTSREVHLPDFKKPPAVETFLGFHFSPLQNWKTPYFGLFWQQIRAEYPEVEVLHPIPSEDTFKIELDAQRVSLRVRGEIPVRWWYFHKSGTRLIQIQNDRFIQNWRKRDINDRYVHYAKLRPAFIQTWTKFLHFLKENKVSVPEINLCEISYVNNIDRGDAWKTFSDLSNVIAGWSGKTSTGFLPNPTLVTLNAVYPIGKTGGSLHVTMQPGLRQPDNTETIQLNLTATCRPTSPRLSDLLSAFDLGRQWIVKGFEDFTNPKMHDLWGKKKRK